MLLWIFAQGYCARHDESFKDIITKPTDEQSREWSLDAEQELMKRYNELEKVFGVAPSFTVGVDMSKVTYKCYKVYERGKVKLEKAEAVKTYPGRQPGYNKNNQHPDFD